MAPTLNTLHIDLRPEWRGGQYQAWLLLRGLQARGYHVELLTVAGSILGARAAHARIPVHEVSPPFLRLRAANCLRRLTRTTTYHAVHAHEAHAHTALWWADLPPTTVRVVSRRVLFPPRTNLISRRKYRHGLDHYIAISEQVRKSLEADAFARANVTVVYDGVELPTLPSPEQRRVARACFGLASDAVVLGCLGTLEPAKGHLQAIEALAIIRKSIPAHLLIAGEGPLHRQLSHRIQALRVASAVQLLGRVDTLEEFFAATDIFLFPAVAEGLGTALLLAMAHQLPVIALAGTAATEVIEDGESGRLILSRHPDTIAGAVVYLARHHDLATQLAANARATIAHQFTADRMVEQTLQVYQTLLARRGRTGA